MIDRDAFIRSIQESPDDDGPRLVYADWLEEQGDSDRAELIRVQCELAGSAECEYAFGADANRTYSCEGAASRSLEVPPEKVVRFCELCAHRQALHARERELLVRYWVEWVGLGGFWFCGNLNDDYASGGRRGLVFSRGFVESVHLPDLTHLDSIYASQPVTKVTLATRPAIEFRLVDESFRKDETTKAWVYTSEWQANSFIPPLMPMERFRREFVVITDLDMPLNYQRCGARIGECRERCATRRTIEGHLRYKYPRIRELVIPPANAINVQLATNRADIQTNLRNARDRILRNTGGVVSPIRMSDTEQLSSGIQPGTPMRQRIEDGRWESSEDPTGFSLAWADDDTATIRCPVE